MYRVANQSRSVVGGEAPGRGGRMVTRDVYLTVPREFDATIVNSPESCFIVDGICIMKCPSFSASIRYL